MIKFYLERIDKNKSINYNSFLNYLTKNDITFTENKFKNIFIFEKDIKQKFFLKIKDKLLFDQYFSRFLVEENDTKLKAALSGNSKLKKNEYSLLTIKENYDDTNALSIAFYNESFLPPPQFNLKEKAIIIENLLNFCRCEDFLKNEGLNLSDYNIIYGSGNSISNKHFSSLLLEYNEVLCCFDIDLDGIKFILTLEKNGLNNISFFFSERQKSIGSKFYRNIDNKEYEKILEFKYKDNPLISDVYRYIRTNKFFVEQEVFISGEKNDE